MMLAEISTNVPVGIAGFLGCLAFLLMIYNEGCKAKRNALGEPSKPPAGELDIRVGSLASDVRRIDGDVKRVDGAVQQLRQDINTNGELRKNTMLSHIEDVRTKLDHKIDSQTHALNNKIDSTAREQTRQLLTMLKGKHD